MWEGSLLNILFGDLFDGVEDITVVLLVVSVLCYFLCFLDLFFEKLFVHGHVVFQCLF